MNAPLAGKVALVTGASRGIGKGVALVLAEQGATVYVTGRTVNEGDYYLPGTVGGTAAECDARGAASGGKGVAVACDHNDDAAVAALFDRIEREQGKLDILVNSATQLSDDLLEPKPFFEKPLSNLEMWDVGMRSYYVCSWHAAKLMARQRSGLIVMISGYTGVTYTYGVLFSATKCTVDRIARDMAIELEPFNVATVSLWQGLTLTEKAQDNLARAADKMTGSVAGQTGSSVEHPGRVIAAMACDPKIMDRSGGTYITAEIADDYGVVDVDGRRIDSMRDKRGSPLWGPIRRTTTMGARREALNALLDKQAIREALEAFSRGMDRFDREAFLAAFWEDAEIAAGPFVGSAADCWDWAMPMHREGQELTQHGLLQSTIDLDGDTAHAETYYQFVARNRDGSLMLAGGRYIDRLERRGGQWRIALRTNQVEWSCLPPALPLPFADLPDGALNGVSARSPDDPSYQRPLVNRRARQLPDA